MYNVVVVVVVEITFNSIQYYHRIQAAKNSYCLGPTLTTNQIAEEPDCHGAQTVIGCYCQRSQASK